MEKNLVDMGCMLKYLDDTKEYYAWTDNVSGAHAIGDTPQEALINLLDLLPDLVRLEPRKPNMNWTKDKIFKSNIALSI